MTYIKRHLTYTRLVEQKRDILLFLIIIFHDPSETFDKSNILIIKSRTKTKKIKSLYFENRCEAINTNRPNIVAFFSVALSVKRSASGFLSFCVVPFKDPSLKFSSSGI